MYIDVNTPFNHKNRLKIRWINSTLHVERTRFRRFFDWENVWFEWFGKNEMLSVEFIFSSYEPFSFPRESVDFVSDTPRINILRVRRTHPYLGIKGLFYYFMQSQCKYNHLYIPYALSLQILQLIRFEFIILYNAGYQQINRIAAEIKNKKNWCEKYEVHTKYYFITN